MQTLLAKASVLFLSSLTWMVLGGAAWAQTKPSGGDALRMRTPLLTDGSVGVLRTIAVPRTERVRSVAMDGPTSVKRPRPPEDERSRGASAAAEIDDHLRVMQACHDLARRTDKALGSRLTVEFKIAGTQVVAFQLKDENLGQRQIVRCLERRFGRFAVSLELWPPGPGIEVRVLDVGVRTGGATERQPGFQPSPGGHT